MCPKGLHNLEMGRQTRALLHKKEKSKEGETKNTAA